MAYLTSQTKKEIQEIIREFGFSSEKEFVSQAVKEKLMELKKLRFFLISEKIRKGLEKKGIKPEELLKKQKNVASGFLGRLMRFPWILNFPKKKKKFGIYVLSEQKENIV
jgi:hypothetical protein